MLLLQNQSRDGIASRLLEKGFVQKAAAQLNALFSSPDKSALKNTTTNDANPLARLAAMHTEAANAKAALYWALKISDVPLQAQCLYAIAFALTPREEGEFMLRGDQRNGARFSAHIQFPGYGSSYNSEE